MPTNFPTSVDNFTNPTANDSLNLPSHSTQHANANDAIEAVEDYLLNGAGKTGLVYIAGAGFSAASAININNVFSSTYRNYRVIIESYSTSTGTAMNFQFRNGGSNRNDNLYLSQTTGSYGSTAFNASATSTFYDMGAVNAEGYYVFDVFSPAVVTNESWILGQGFGYQNNVSSFVQRNYGVNYSVANGNDGFAITSSGTATCYITVYGYKA